MRNSLSWFTDVKLWEAEHKDETKPPLGPRLCRRGLLGQPKESIKTLLGQGDFANFTVDNTITTLRNPEEEVLGNNFDMRQSPAEAIQDYINREEMLSLSLQNSTKIAPNDKMRGCWLIRASASSEQEIADIRIVTEGSAGLSALKKAIQLTFLSRGRKEVRDEQREEKDRARDKTGSAGDDFHTFSDGESKSETDLESLDEPDLWYATDAKAERDAVIGLREAREKLQRATGTENVLQDMCQLP